MGFILIFGAGIIVSSILSIEEPKESIYAPKSSTGKRTIVTAIVRQLIK